MASIIKESVPLHEVEVAGVCGVMLWWWCGGYFFIQSSVSSLTQESLLEISIIR